MNFLCMSEPYKPGDPRPDGYIQWHDWARVQFTAGRRQRRCPHGKFLFAQEHPCRHR